MTTAYLFLLNTFSITAGTFLANFALLWMIGTKVKEAEKKQIELYTKMQQEYAEVVKKEVEKRKAYLAMES